MAFAAFLLLEYNCPRACGKKAQIENDIGILDKTGS